MNYLINKERKTIFEDLNYIFNIKANCSNNDISDIRKSVIKHSPNYRTILEANSINWSVVSNELFSDYEAYYREPKYFSKNNDVYDKSLFKDDCASSNLIVYWEYGMQLGLVNVTALKNTCYFQIDQAKQLGGIDKGPNPQEYSLAGLGSSILQTFVDLVNYHGLLLHEVTLLVEGKVDIRGLLGVDLAVHSKIQDIKCILSINNDNSNMDIYNELCEVAIQSSPVSVLFTKPHDIASSLVLHET